MIFEFIFSENQHPDFLNRKAKTHSMSGFQRLAPAAIQAPNVCATFVQSARWDQVSDRWHGETREVIVKARGNVIVESGERDVPLGGHRLRGVVHRVLGSRRRGRVPRRRR